MRLFRRTEFDGLIPVNPLKASSLTPVYRSLTVKEEELRKRQENGSATEFPVPPATAASGPVSASSLLSDLLSGTAPPSLTPSSSGLDLLGLSSFALLPTAAASSTPSLAEAPSSDPGTESSGLADGGASTQEPEIPPSIAAATTSVAPETTNVALPSSAEPVITEAPSSSNNPDTSFASVESSPPSATPAAPSSEVATTGADAVAPTGTGSVEPTTTSPIAPVQPGAPEPTAEISSPILPVPGPSSSAAAPPAQSSSRGTVLVVSSHPASVSAAPHVSSGPVSSLSSQVAALISSHGSSSFTLAKSSGASNIVPVSTQPAAAAELSNPTLATSIITSVTTTGSVPGVSTETTGSGIIVTQTVAPSKMDAGKMAGVVVGAAAGGLILAALLLLLIRKLFRIRRIVKAESPPSSPLLEASRPPVSPMPPLRIEVGMHQRMLGDDSDFWLSGKGSSISEKEVEGHGYPIPVSSLPSLSEGGEGARRDKEMESGGFKFFP